MARKVPSDNTSQLPTRSNPDLFGEDLVPLAWEAVGVGLAEFGNQKIAAPVARQLVPGLAGGTEAKLVDALTTAGTGWAAGEVVSMVSRPAGNKIRRGGVLLGVAKVIAAFVPGFNISASFPNLPIPAISAPGNSNGKVGALPTQTTQTAMARLGVGTMGL